MFTALSASKIVWDALLSAGTMTFDRFDEEDRGQSDNVLVISRGLCPAVDAYKLIIHFNTGSCKSSLEKSITYIKSYTN